jgi:hypothetical protein
MAWTATDLIASVKRRAGIPAAQATYTDAEILTICNEEMSSFIVPLVMKEREDYWQTSVDFTITSSVTQYRIPERAIGSKLREVKIVNANGTESNIPRLLVANEGTDSYGFRVDGNVLTLRTGIANNPTLLGNTLRVYFYSRPNQITAATIGTTYGTIATLTLPYGMTVTSAPTGLTGASGTMDMIRATPGFETLAADAAFTLSTGVYTFSAPLPAGIAVGDYVTVPGNTPVPQIPPELHPLLAQKAACRVLEGKGMYEKLKSLREEVAVMEVNARAMLTPRVDGEAPRAVVRSGLFRLRW